MDLMETLFCMWGQKVKILYNFEGDIKMDLVSVILPTYNRAEHIRAAVDSVLAQDYEEMEILVIDDASTDDTEAVIRSIHDSRLQYVRKEVNSGAAAARNRGLSMAGGKYIAFQDSDDLWEPGKLKRQLARMREDYGMVFAVNERTHRDGSKEMVPHTGLPREKLQGWIYPHLLAESFMSTPSMLVDAAVIQEVGGFDENMMNYEDYELALRIAKCVRVGFVDDVLVRSRILPDSIDMNMSSGILSSAYLLKKYETDLRAYGLYERKYQVVMEAAAVYGMSEPIRRFIGRTEKERGESV